MLFGNLGGTRSGSLRLSSSYPGILLEPLEGLVASELRFHPIQRSLLCQAGANRCRGFATAFARCARSRASTSSSVASIFSAVAMRSSSNSAFTSSTARSLLPLPHGHPIHVDRARIHSLRRQRCAPRAPGACPSGVPPALREPGNRARRRSWPAALAHRRRRAADRARPPGPRALSSRSSSSVCDVADVLGEFVVQLGQLLFLDGQNLDAIGVVFAGQLWIGIVGGIVDLEAACSPVLRAAQIFREGFQGLFGADMAEHVVGLQRFAAADGRAHQLELRVVAAWPAARPSMGTNVARALAQLLELSFRRPRRSPRRLRLPLPGPCTRRARTPAAPRRPRGT